MYYKQKIYSTQLPNTELTELSRKHKLKLNVNITKILKNSLAL